MKITVQVAPVTILKQRRMATPIRNLFDGMQLRHAVKNGLLKKWASERSCAEICATPTRITIVTGKDRRRIVCEIEFLIHARFPRNCLFFKWRSVKGSGGLQIRYFHKSASARL